MINKAYLSPLKIFGFISILISIFIFLLLGLLKIHILMDLFPFLINALVFPLPTFLLFLYESNYQINLSNFNFFIIGYILIVIFYFLFSVSGIGILRNKAWGKKLLIILISFNALITILILIFFLTIGEFRGQNGIPGNSRDTVLN